MSDEVTPAKPAEPPATPTGAGPIRTPLPIPPVGPIRTPLPGAPTGAIRTPLPKTPGPSAGAIRTPLPQAPSPSAGAIRTPLPQAPGPSAGAIRTPAAGTTVPAVSAHPTPAAGTPAPPTGAPAPGTIPPPAAATVHTGMVSKYERKRGYGFITPSAGGEDVFVRQGSIRMEGITFLVPGDQVRYELESTGNGTQAVAVALTAPRAEKKRSLPRLSDLPLPPLSSLLSPIALARALVRRPILLVVLAAVLALFAADWLGLSAGDRPKPTDPADDGSAGMLLTECGAVSAPALPSSVRDRPTASDVLAHAHGASLADLQDFLGKPDQILPSNHGIRWVALWWSACQLDNPGKHWPVAHVGVVFAGTVAGQPDQAHEVRTNIIGSHGLILRSDGP